MENNNKSIQIYAKLLSTSDITLSYSSSTDTAYYEFNKKKIVLPVLSWADIEVQQMMTSHEVGHYYNMESIGDITALFNKYGHSLVNILEDVYIEKWIKNNYNGLNNIFDSGYKIAFKERFFGVSNVDKINKMSFLDRLNIYFKCRNILNKKIIFSSEETYFVGRIHCMTSREDFFSILEDLYCYLSKNQKEFIIKSGKFNNLKSNSSESYSSSDNNEKNNSSAENNQNDDNNENNDEKDYSENNDECETNTDDDCFQKKSNNLNENDNESEQIDYGNDFKSETQDNFNETVKNNINKYNSKNTFSYYIDTKNNNSFNNKIDDVELIRESVNKTLEEKGYWGEIFENNDIDKYRVTKNNYEDFIKLIKKMAVSGNTFFNQYKSAKKLREKKYKNTGNIDRSELAYYKTTTDIFKRKVLSCKEQSHAVVITIDLSNSIRKGINTIIAQTSILAEFCKYNKIKFKIFGFGLFCKKCKKDECCNYYDIDTSPILLVDDEHWKTDSLLWLAYKTKVMNVTVDDNLSIKWDFYNTPINKALYVCYNALEEYKINGYQKVSLFVITDGASYNDEIYINDTKYNTKYKFTTDDDKKISYGKLNNKTYCIFINNEKENYNFKIIENYEYKNSLNHYGARKFYLLDSIFPASLFLKMKNKLNANIYFSYITENDFRKTYTSRIPYIHEIEYLSKNSNFSYYDENDYKGLVFCDCYDVDESSFAKKLFIANYMNILDKDYLEIYKKYSSILKKFVTEIAKDIA